MSLQKFADESVVGENCEIFGASLFTCKSEGFLEYPQTYIFKWYVSREKNERRVSEYKQRQRRQRRWRWWFDWGRDALTPRCFSTGATVPSTPDTSYSRSASSMRPCPWWRVHWDPWLQPHPPCRKSGKRVRLHRKINKDGLRVAIGRYARNANDGLVGDERKRGNLASRGREHPRPHHRDLPITGDRFIRETRRMQTDMKIRQMASPRKLVISIAFCILGLLNHISWEKHRIQVPSDLWVATSLSYPSQLRCSR